MRRLGSEWAQAKAIADIRNCNRVTVTATGQTHRIAGVPLWVDQKVDVRELHISIQLWQPGIVKAFPALQCQQPLLCRT